MRYAEITLPEFEHEMANTRKVLELVPDDKFEWCAGPSFHTIGWNANHLAEIPGWVEGTLTKTSWDLAPADGPHYQSPALASCGAILKLFDQNVADAMRAIAAVKDEELDQMWSLMKAGQTFFTVPRRHVIRSFVLNHIIHHRAHLLVYLRLNNIACPGMYGPG
jgi:uncharacterized damage-inducible protein DinB